MYVRKGMAMSRLYKQGSGRCRASLGLTICGSIECGTKGGIDIC